MHLLCVYSMRSHIFVNYLLKLSIWITIFLLMCFRPVFLPRALTLRISLFFFFFLKYLVTLYLRCKQGCSTSHASMFGARSSIFYLFHPGWHPWKPIPLRYVLWRRDVRVCFCFNTIASFKKDACWHHRNKRSQSWNIFHINDYKELCLHTSVFRLFECYTIWEKISINSSKTRAHNIFFSKLKV